MPSNVVADVQEVLTLRMAVRSDLEGVGRLRYEVYICEQGKPYPNADHARRVLIDALDEQAEIVLVESGERTEGTVRCNSLLDNPARVLYQDQLELHLFEAMSPSEMVVCSRLAVDPIYRHSTVRDLLFDTINRHRAARGTKLCFATCAPALLRLFKFYGFREYGTPTSDPYVGPLHRTVLVLDDVDWLMEVKSPFARAAIELGLKRVDRPWLDGVLRSAAGEANP